MGTAQEVNLYPGLGKTSSCSIYEQASYAHDLEGIGKVEVRYETRGLGVLILVRDMEDDGEICGVNSGLYTFSGSEGGGLVCYHDS